VSGLRRFGLIAAIAEIVQFDVTLLHGSAPMKSRHRHFLAKLATVGALSALFVNAAADETSAQSTRTIKIVVAVPPGGITDILARLLGEQISRTQGPTVLVENRPGAGGVIGTEAVARAAPDGNTLLIAANPFVINPQMRKVNYDPLTSFEPICHLMNTPTIVVVNSGSRYRTFAELLETARARPGQLTLASIGPGSPYHLSFEILKRSAKVDMTFVPYPGNAPAINALLGNHVTSMFGTYPDVAEQLKGGSLRALAVASPTQSQWGACARLSSL
jgi:tripartite-type tricarboxylate transporter receptor subunit TctC